MFRHIFLALLLLAYCTAAHTQDPAALYKEGLAKAQEGKLDEAIELFTRTIELVPEDYYAWFNRGIARSMQNRYELAILDFEKAISLKPDFKRAVLNKGITLRKLTDYEGAIAVYTSLITEDPEYSDAWFNRGLIYEMLKKRDSACHDYEKAKAAGGKNLDGKLKSCEDKEPVVTYSILRLSKQASSDQYGFTEANPIRTGPGPFGGPSNQRAFLDLLRDPGGNPVRYERLGSCCMYKSDIAPLGMAMLDKYKLYYTDGSGQAATAVLFISMYEYEEPMIPAGFNTIVWPR